jgi:hypothetical protein
MPLKYSDLKIGDVLLKHSAGTKTNMIIKTGQAAGRTLQPKIVPIDADYRHISPKEVPAKSNTSADWSHPGRTLDN